MDAVKKVGEAMGVKVKAILAADIVSDSDRCSQEAQADIIVMASHAAQGRRCWAARRSRC